MLLFGSRGIGSSTGNPADRKALLIEAVTLGQWPAYNNKFRASASSQLMTVLLPKKFNGAAVSKTNLDRERGGIDRFRQ
jgi:hypothetical protein